MQARTLDDCLNADESLARLTAHAGHLLKLQRIIDTTIPSALLQACRIANYRLGIVFIHADNGAVAAKLRQLAPSLCEELRSGGRQITEIRVKVQPRECPPPRINTESVPALGLRSKQGLTDLANGLPEDSPLRASLERLLRSR